MLHKICFTLQTLKRQPPPTLQKILELDANVTQRFVLWANKLLPFRTTKIHYKTLEVCFNYRIS